MLPLQENPRKHLQVLDLQRPAPTKEAENSAKVSNSGGLPRQASRILCTAMRLAVPKGLNHLPDELLQQAIAELQ
ncbi:hypothetical protein [Roseateles sp.]|uniref:hypothetical protein n=1 Tax=Roseateles sp. TaxID=1971397 RepID=UPI0025FAE961|nr:hypothetical protein [Roseateles sp.]